MTMTGRRSLLGWRRRGSGGDRARSRRFQPELCSLEGRRLLSTYTLDGAGNLWKYNSGVGQIIDNGVASFAVGHAGTPWANDVFALKADGELQESTGNGFFDIDTGVTSFALGTAGPSGPTS